MSSSTGTNKTYFPRQPAFRRLYLGMAVSTLGTSFSLIAIMAKFAELSGDTKLWPFLAATRALPFCLFGVLAGQLVDSVSRKRLLTLCDSVRCLLYLALVFCARLDALFAIVFLGALFGTPYEPGVRSLMAGLLEGEELLAANSIWETSKNLISIGGLGLAGVLVAIVGTRGCFYFDAATYLFSALNLFWLGIPKEADETGVTRKNLKQDLLEGWSFLVGAKELYYAMGIWTLMALVTGLQGPLFFPLMEEKHWGGAVAAGWLSASFAVGSLFVTFFLVKRTSSPVARFRNLAAFLLFDTLMVLSLTQLFHYWQALAVCFFLGVTEAFLDTFAITEIQRRVPRALMGRVFASISSIHEPMRLLCMVGAGIIVDKASAVTGFYIAGLFEGMIGVILCAIVLRNAARRDPAGSSASPPALR